MKKLVLFTMAALMLLSLMTAAQGEGAQTLQWMLDRLPQAAFADGYLSFVDYHALVGIQPGAEAPASAEEAAAHFGTPAGQAYMRALRGASSGYHNLLMYMNLPEVKASSGLDPFLMAQSMEVGQPVQQAWIRGPIEEEDMRSALEQKGYQPMDETGAMTLWCEGGTCDGGTRVDFARRDPAFLFGGDLGRFWPMALQDDLAVAVRDAEPARQIAAQQGPMVGEDPRFQAMLQAVSQPDGETTTQLVQMMTVARPERIPGGLLTFAQAVTQDALWVVVTLPWPGSDDAEALEAAKRHALEVPLTGPGLDTLETELEHRGGTLQQPRLEQANGHTLLVLPFRFAAPADAAERNPGAASSLPYQWFVDRLFREDLAWLPTP